MRLPTRQECERQCPQLKLDSEWQLHPVIGEDGNHIGHICIYRVGERVFATPIIKAKPKDTHQ